MLYVAQNEYLKALELFKTALGISPNVSLFWASYIDTLIKLNRITDAKAIAQAAKLAQQEALEAEERAEREAMGDETETPEALAAAATTAQDADSGEKEEAPTKSRKNKGGAKEMIYQKKNRNEEDSSFKVKNGSKTNVYRKKEPVE